MNVFQSKVKPLYRVRIDGDHGGDIFGIVTCVSFYAKKRCLVCVSWIANGAHYEEWFDEERLEIVDRQ